MKVPGTALLVVEESGKGREGRASDQINATERSNVKIPRRFRSPHRDPSVLTWRSKGVFIAPLQWSVRSTALRPGGGVSKGRAGRTTVRERDPWHLNAVSRGVSVVRFKSK